MRLSDQERSRHLAALRHRRDQRRRKMQTYIAHVRAVLARGAWYRGFAGKVANRLGLGQHARALAGLSPVSQYR